MQEQIERNEQLNRYVQQTLNSRVRPMELWLEPIFDCYGGSVLAYRAQLCINSILAGVLEPDDYCNGNADGQVLWELTVRSLEKALPAAYALECHTGKPCRLFVRCPSSCLMQEELYSTLSQVRRQFPETRAAVCLTFDRDVTELSRERLEVAFADIRSADFAVAVSGYGGDGFCMEKLLAVCPDYVFLDGSMASLATDREKRAVLPALIQLVRGLGGEVIACDIHSDEELREFRSRECFGFLPSDAYRGALPVKSGKRSIADEMSTEAT